MDLKVLQNNEARAGITPVPSIRSKVPLVLGAAFLAILGTNVCAQSRSDSTADIAKYAMKLPEKTLVRIDPKIIRLPARNGLQVPGLIDRTGSTVSERNSLGTGTGEYAWKVGISTTVFWIGEQATDNNPVGNDKSAWDAAWT